MAIERILSTDSGKVAFEKTDRNFTGLEQQINVLKGINYDNQVEYLNGWLLQVGDFNIQKIGKRVFVNAFLSNPAAQSNANMIKISNTTLLPKKILNGGSLISNDNTFHRVTIDVNGVIKYEGTNSKNILWAELKLDWEVSL